MRFVRVDNYATRDYATIDITLSLNNFSIFLVKFLRIAAKIGLYHLKSNFHST